MGKKFMGYDNASELLTAIGNKIKAKYSKPSGGIPKTDLASAVQTLLDGIPSPPSGFKRFDTLPHSDVVYQQYQTDGFAVYGPIVYFHSNINVPAGVQYLILFDITIDPKTPYQDEWPLVPLSMKINPDASESANYVIPVYDTHGSMCGTLILMYEYEPDAMLVFSAALYLDTAPASAKVVSIDHVYIGKKPW